MTVRVMTCALALGVTACTVGPDFTPPKPPDVAAWNDPSAHRTNAPVSPATNPDPKWWDGFKDPVLTALIEKAIGGNLDLQQAVLRVVESRQGEVTARAAAERERQRQLRARPTRFARPAAVHGHRGPGELTGRARIIAQHPQPRPR